MAQTMNMMTYKLFFYKILELKTREWKKSRPSKR